MAIDEAHGATTQASCAKRCRLPHSCSARPRSCHLADVRARFPYSLEDATLTVRIDLERLLQPIASRVKGVMLGGGAMITSRIGWSFGVLWGFGLLGSACSGSASRTTPPNTMT